MYSNSLSSRASNLFALDLSVLVGVLSFLSILFSLQATSFFIILVFIILFGNVIRDIYYFTHKTEKISSSLMQGLIIGYIPSFLFLYLFEVCRQNCLHSPINIDSILASYSLIPFLVFIPIALFTWNKVARDIIEGLYVLLVIFVTFLIVLFPIFSDLIRTFDFSLFVLHSYKSFIVLLISFPLSYMLILFFRKLFYHIRSTYPRKNIAIIGYNDKSRLISENFSRFPKNEYTFKGFISLNNQDDIPENHLGSIETISDIIKNSNITTLINCSEGSFHPDTMKNIYYGNKNLEIIDFMDMYELLTRSVPLQYVDSQWINSNINIHSRSYYFIHKRAMDIITALIILIVTLPVTLTLYIVTKLTDKGNFLYSHDRLGQYNKIFKCIKVRTMVTDADKHKLGYQGATNDPRITPIGRFIRPLRLDEIPQMINVIKGDLAIVGPRPDVPQFEEPLAKIIPFHHLRRTVPQGWSGWAQINGGHSDTLESNKEKFEYDLYYLKHCSLLFDLTVFFRALILATSGKHG